jgi:PIN domain nuclease of toxin-antitoxin system
LRVLLDTTALYVAASGNDASFSPNVQRLLGTPETERLVSPISFNEIAIKANNGLTSLRREDVQQLITDLALTVLSLTGGHALRLFGLPAHHADPFDRILIATALAEDVAIVASDREFQRYEGLRVIW